MARTTPHGPHHHTTPHDQARSLGPRTADTSSSWALGHCCCSSSSPTRPHPSIPPSLPCSADITYSSHGHVASSLALSSLCLASPPTPTPTPTPSNAASHSNLVHAERYTHTPPPHLLHVVQAAIHGAGVTPLHRTCRPEKTTGLQHAPSRSPRRRCCDDLSALLRPSCNLLSLPLPLPPPFHLDQRRPFDQLRRASPALQTPALAGLARPPTGHDLARGIRRPPRLDPVSPSPRRPSRRHVDLSPLEPA